MEESGNFRNSKFKLSTIWIKPFAKKLNGFSIVLKRMLGYIRPEIMGIIITFIRILQGFISLLFWIVIGRLMKNDIKEIRNKFEDFFCGFKIIKKNDNVNVYQNPTW